MLLYKYPVDFCKNPATLSPPSHPRSIRILKKRVISAFGVGIPGRVFCVVLYIEEHNEEGRTDKGRKETGDLPSWIAVHFTAQNHHRSCKHVAPLPATSASNRISAPRPEHVPIDFRSCPNYGPTPAVSGTAGYDPNRSFRIHPFQLRCRG